MTTPPRLTIFIPALLALFVSLVSVAFAQTMPVTADIYPWCTLSWLYYWMIFMPLTMPYVFLFGLGIMEDVMTGMPLGLSSLLFVIMRVVIERSRRKIGSSIFFALWAGFVTVSCGIFIWQWIVMMLVTSAWHSVTMPMMKWSLTVLSYPLIHWLCARVHHSFREER